MRKHVCAALLIAAAVALAACGGGSGSQTTAAAAAEDEKTGNAEDSSSEEADGAEDTVGEASSETWGDWSFDVPAGFSLKGGDFLDENDPRYFSVKKSDFSYFEFKAEGEERIKKNYDYNKTTYTNEQKDVSDTFGGNKWTGFQYSDGFGGYGFEAYATIGGEMIRVSSAGFSFDNETVKEVLGSLTYNGADAGETDAAGSTEEPAAGTKTGAEADRVTGDEGKYIVMEYEANGQKVNHDTLVASGMGDTYLWLKPGGEAELYLFNQSIDATWKPGVVTTYGTADYTYELDGDILTLDMAGVTYVMARDDSAGTGGGSSAGAKADSGKGSSDGVTGTYYLTYLGEMSIQEFAELIGGTVDEYAQMMKVELRSDGTFVFVEEGEPEEGVYTLEGNTVTLDEDGEKMTGTLEGDVLTFDLEGETMVFSKTRPTGENAAGGTASPTAEADKHPAGVPGGDGIVSEEMVQKGYVWLNKVNKDPFKTTYEDLAAFFGAEGEFDKEEYSDHMKVNKRYYKWISSEDKDHFLYVNFEEKNPDIYMVSGYNTSGFLGSEAIDRYLSELEEEAREADKAAATNMAMKDFSIDIHPFGKNDDIVTVKMQIPESGWAWDEAKGHLVENEDINTFGAGFIQLKLQQEVEKFDFYKNEFENYKDIDDREFGGVTFKGRTYKNIGYDWTEYIAQIDDDHALSIGVVRVDIEEGTAGDKILSSIAFR